METVLKAIADWIKGILTAGIMSNLSGLFDDVNAQVGNIAQQVGTKPSSFEPRVFAMIEALSRNVVLPIAGIILTFIACYELIEMITQHNNMAQFEPALIMRWIFKTAVSVWLISNTFDIVMAVFDITQKVVSDSSGIIAGNTRVNDIGLSMLQSSLMQMDVGPLFGLFLQSFFIGITMRILSIVIFVIVYGRMIEIYCMVSLAPIPMATFGNHEQSHMGQNYLKCLFALGFQGFLILICVAIYAVLIQSVAISGDAINSIWSIVGYPLPENMPLLEDLYNALLTQDEPEARHVAAALEIYVKGSLNIFNHHTNVDIHNRIVCFDIKQLGKQLKKLGMLIVQDAVWGRVTANREAGKSTRYFVDEFHLLLKEEQTAAYSVEIWKRFRKWGGIPTGLTQNCKDLLSSPEVSNIFENSDMIIMLNQANGDRQILAKQLNISPHQLSYVTHSGSGEGLLFYGNTILPFVDHFPHDLELYKIMTTKLSEVTGAEKHE